MRSIGNDIKSSSSSSPITQAHLDDAHDDAGVAAALIATTLIAAQAEYEVAVRVAAKSAETTARTAAITAASAAETTARNAAIALEVDNRNDAITAASTAETTARNTAIALEVDNRNGAIVAASATETTARTAAITAASATETTTRAAAITTVLSDSKAYTDAAADISEAYTDAKVSTAHAEIAANGYFDKIITSTASISDGGWGSTYAGFAHEKSTKLNYALLQHEGGATYINSKTGMPIEFMCNDTSTMKLTTADGLTPSTTESYNLGASALRWLNLYCKTGYFDTLNVINATVSGGLSPSSDKLLDLGSYNFHWRDTYSNTFLATKEILTPLLTSTKIYTETVEADSTNLYLRGGNSLLHLKNGYIGHSHSFSYSDSRLKTNQVDYTDGWADFKTIKVKKYNRYGDNSTIRIGVIADEIKINPTPLIQNSYKQMDGITTFGGTDYENLGSVDYDVLYRMNLRVTQQLMARVEALELALSKKS